MPHYFAKIIFWKIFLQKYFFQKCFANWKIFLEFFFQKYFFQKYFCDNIFGENIFVKIFFDHFGNFFQKYFWRLGKNIFVKIFLVKIFLVKIFWWKYFLIILWSPRVSLFSPKFHSFIYILLKWSVTDARTHGRTDAMSVPFIVLDQSAYLYGFFFKL